MTNTLLISYTPRYDSNTQKLVHTFIEALPAQSTLTHLNLVNTPPPLLLEDNLNALIKTNFMGEALNEKEQQAVRGANGFLQSLLEADRIAIAFPLYNFSLPATVKAWVDVVVQKGATFTIDSNGNYEGLCHHKKALILMSSGTDFGQEAMAHLDHGIPLMSACLGFMGIESHAIAAYGLDQYADKASDIVATAQQDIKAFLASDTAWAM